MVYYLAILWRTADVTSAYLQAELKGTTTWVHIPEHRWAEHWFKIEGGEVVGKVYHIPVCPLGMALHGHPDSGGPLGATL